MSTSATLEVLGPSVTSTAITTKTLVVCGHRGGPDLLGCFDGEKYEIPAGKEFLMPYGIALALRRRAVVPGTRDPHFGGRNGPLKQKSYLYIKHAKDGRKVPEADKLEDCRPFTAEELRRIGASAEAIARAPGEAQLLSVTDVQATILSQGGPDLDAEVTAPVDPAVLAPIPASENSHLRTARADAAERAGEARGGRRR